MQITNELILESFQNNTFDIGLLLDVNGPSFFDRFGCCFATIVVFFPLSHVQFDDFYDVEVVFSV